jgi:hypothetical protein
MCAHAHARTTSHRRGTCQTRRGSRQLQPPATGGVPIAVRFEITTRLGNTLLDVTHTEGTFALCDLVLVSDGTLIAPARGRVGLVDYDIRTVEPPNRELPLAHTDDRRAVPYIVAALAVHLAVWAAAKSEPAEPTAHAATKPRLRTAAIAHASDHRAELPDAATTDRAHDTKGNGKAAAARGDEGRAGAAQAPRDAGHIAIANTGEEPQLAKAAAIAQARSAGILGDSKTMAEQFHTLGGTDAITSGFDDRKNVTAAADGADGAGRGAFGTGRSGEGTGGGGYRTMGTIGLGSYSMGTTNGHAWGGSVEVPHDAQWSTWSGHYDGGYYPAGHLRSVSLPGVLICAGTYAARCHVAGDLDPAIVRRYVKRNIQKLAYCYEKELLAKPDLAGPVLVGFAITNGHVEDATAAGLDPTVASCVRETVENIEFPSAGATRVDYVLVFYQPARQGPVSNRNATPSPITQPPSPR